MLRRLLVVALVAVAVTACGSGTPTASPSASASVAPTAAPTEAPTEEEPTVEPTAVELTTMTAVCNAVGIRKLPSSTGALIVRVGAGTVVRVVEVVPGDPYKGGNCGAAGDTWLKLDRVGGKSVKALYGVSFAYSAAGFFK